MTDFEDKMAELRHRFVARGPAMLEELRGALAAQDREAVRGLAHRLAGNAGMFGFPRVSEAAAELESAAIDGHAETVELQGEELARMLQNLVTGEPECES